MKYSKIILLIVLIISLASCFNDSLNRLFGNGKKSFLTLQFHDDKKSSFEKYLNIVNYRLDKMGAELILISLQNNKLVGEIVNYQNLDDVKKIFQIKGEVLLKSDTSQSLSNNQIIINDIKSTEISKSSTGDNYFCLDIKLSNNRNLYDFSSKHVGEVINFFVDDVKLLSAKLAEPIPNGMIRLTFPKEYMKNIKILSIILESGTLPFKVNDIDIKLEEKNLTNASS